MNVLEPFGEVRASSASQALAPLVGKFGVYLCVVSFACVYYVINGPQLLGHYDLGWHLAAGDLIRDRGSVPFQDPWSFTLGDRQWFNASWLWDVLASLVFQYARFDGLLALVVACGALMAGYLTAICRRAGASAVAVCATVFLVCLLYPSFASFPNIYLAAAPNMATMLFSVVFYGECLKKPRWFVFPLLMLLWVNLHGGFVLGFLILGVFGGVALLRRDWTSVNTYSIAGVGCFAAIFVNPLGWQIYYGVVTTVGHFVQGYITEWLPYAQNISWPGSIPGMIYILAFAYLELRFGRVARIPLEARLLSWLFLALGFYQFRYLAFFFLFSSVVLALHIDRLLSKTSDQLKIEKSLFAAGLMGLCALPLAFAQVRPALGFPQILSEQDAAYLKTHFAHARILNHWNVGGLLIFYARGDVPVFVDGRAATAYPDDLLHDYFKLPEMEIDEAAWDAVLAKYRIDAVLWVKAHEQLRRFLVDKRGWKEVYAGNYESVYAKP